MVYLAPQNLGYRPYFMRWLNIRNNRMEIKVMKILFDKYIPATLEYLLPSPSLLVPLLTFYVVCCLFQWSPLTPKDMFWRGHMLHLIRLVRG